jgi:uncharacterized protein YjbJ (UPF0337 family)
MKARFHELKGTIKEQIGKVTNDRMLRVEGKIEKNTGKVKRQISHAKDAVATLDGKLGERKDAGWLCGDAADMTTFFLCPFIARIPR